MLETNDPVLSEIDAALRHDRLVAAWKKYRVPVMVVVALCILSTLGYTQWKAYRLAKAGEAMLQLTSAQALMQDEQFTEAATKFAAIAAAHPSPEITDMALLWQARALVGAGKTPEAINVLLMVAEHPASQQRIWRDLACLRLIALDASKTACLEAVDGSPLQAQRKLTHAAQLWERGAIDQSRTVLEALVNDGETPQSVRDTATQFLSVVAPDARAETAQKR